MRGYLEIFYCSFSVPSAFSRKGGKVEYFKGSEPGTGEKLGVCVCVLFMYFWSSFILELIPSATWILLRLKSQNTQI